MLLPLLVSPEPPLLPPQAARLKTRARAKRMLQNFFILLFSFCQKNMVGICLQFPGNFRLPPRRGAAVSRPARQNPDDARFLSGFCTEPEENMPPPFLWAWERQFPIQKSGSAFRAEPLYCIKTAMRVSTIPAYMRRYSLPEAPGQPADCRCRGK